MTLMGLGLAPGIVWYIERVKAISQGGKFTDNSVGRLRRCVKLTFDRFDTGVQFAERLSPGLIRLRIFDGAGSSRRRDRRTAGISGLLTDIGPWPELLEHNGAHNEHGRRAAGPQPDSARVLHQPCAGR